MEDGKLCECGCGQKTGWNKNKRRINSFIRGHVWKGRGLTEETKAKIAAAHRGKSLSEEHKKKISIGGTGKKRTEETKKNISEALKRHQYDPKRIEQLKKNSFDATGRKWPEEIKRKISESNKGKHHHYGEKNPNWKEGRSFLPYPPEFNGKLKRKILERDGRKCQNPCCKWPDELLSIHHINYIKDNNSENNLIVLCIRCNSKANKNRHRWENLYRRIVEGKQHE